MPESLPPYKVRVSNRTRSIGLKVSHEEGLVITVPRNFDTRLLPSILDEKRGWIERAMRKLTESPPPPAIMPEQIDVRLTNETWKVVYLFEERKTTNFTEKPHHILVIKGNTRSKLVVKRLIKSWIRKRAEELLPDRLGLISQRIGIYANGLTIRDQRTRWGSCSRQNTISLNQKLVLLPPELVEYVLIHELCHTQVHSHSKKFWKHVEYYLPDYLARRKLLREYEKKIPW